MTSKTHSTTRRRVSILGDRALITAAGNASQNVSPAAYIFQRHEKQGWVPCLSEDEWGVAHVERLTKNGR